MRTLRLLLLHVGLALIPVLRAEFTLTRATDRVRGLRILPAFIMPWRAAVRLLRLPLLWVAMHLASGPVEALATTIAPIDVKLRLRKFDAVTGAEVWRSREFVDVRPSRLELFQGRVVAYFRSIKPHSHPYSPRSVPEDSLVVFFDSAIGKETAAFDTRAFVRSEDDKLIAVSPDGYSSMLDERNELHLANGWISYGIGLLAWEGVPALRFFQPGTPSASEKWKEVWTWTRPEGASNIAAWESNILYIQSRGQKGLSVRTLVAIKAGDERPVWKFELPAEVPTMDYPSSLPDEPPIKLRGFDYAAAAKSIFVFGNGFLFTLDPQTGAIRRKLDLRSVPALKNLLSELHWANIQSAGDAHAVIMGDAGEALNPLVNVTWKPSATVKILRRDLFDSRASIAHGESIYCFTAEELPKHARPRGKSL